MIRLFIIANLFGLLATGCSTSPSGVIPTGSAHSASPSLFAEDEVTQCANQVKASQMADPATLKKPKVDLLYWCSKAAEKGDPKSQYVLAGVYEKGLTGVPANAQEALKWYKAAAQGGLADAQFKVGQLYGRGEGVPIDKNEATKWYLKAAEKGHTEAQFYMGYRYAHGKGVTQSYTEAVKWFNKAAEKGNPDAMHGLGELYLKGTGVPQSRVDAYKWFNLSAVTGNREFVASRDKLASKLSPAQLTEGQHLATEWAQKHPAEKPEAP